MGLPGVCLTPASAPATRSFSPQADAVAAPEPTFSPPFFLSPCHFDCSVGGKNGTLRVRHLLGISQWTKRRRWGPSLAPKFKGINISGRDAEPGASAASAMVGAGF